MAQAAAVDATAYADHRRHAGVLDLALVHTGYMHSNTTSACDTAC